MQNIHFQRHHFVHRYAYSSWHVNKRKSIDHEIVLVLNGLGSVEIENKKYDLKKGMLIYLPPLIENAWESNCVEPLEFYALHFDVFIDEKNDKTPLLEKYFEELKDISLLKNLLFSIEKNMYNKTLLGNISMTANLHNLMLEVIKLMQIDNHIELVYQKIKKVISYVEENYKEKITIQKALDITGYSKTYFSKQFKILTGISFISYLNEVRIDKSKSLLINSDYKIKTISKKVGFNDEYYFTKLFSKHEGISPRKYRTVHQFKVQ